MDNHNSLTDEGLISRAIEGDEGAAAQLYHRYADRVFGICYRVVLNSALAKDCAQEVWFKVFKDLHRYRPQYAFNTWISTIAVRTAIDEYRKRGRRNQVPIDENVMDRLVDLSDTARLGVEEMEVQEQIERALRDLSEAQRAAFVLRHFEGEEIPEISRILGCNPGTAKTHIHRAVQSLRKSLAYLQERIPHVR